MLQRVAQEHGLILVDTKYEFGKGRDGSILLIDEVCLYNPYCIKCYHSFLYAYSDQEMMTMFFILILQL